MAGSNVFWIIRVAALSVVALFSFITLALSAAYIGKVMSFNNSSLFVTVAVPAFAGLALAISLITLLALGGMLVVDFIRRGALTSWVLVELSVFGLLTILWLATAADTAAATLGITIDCGAADQVGGDDSFFCHAYQSIEAFSFLNWLIMMFYTIGLLVFALISSSRGNKGVWKSSVRDTNFFARAEGTNVQMQQPYQPTMQPQYTGQPQQYGTPQSYAAQV